MADVAASTIVTSDTQVSPGKKGVQKKDKKAERPKASHPTTAVMVNNAIQNLKERGGSSLQAIKKYISATYKIDGEKFAPFIKKYLKASVTAGTLVQTKGKGASGSFKLASSAVTKKPTTAAKKSKKAAIKPVTTKPKAKTTVKPTTETKKSAPVNSAKTKKSATVEKKKPAAVQVAKPKSPSKAKKTAKAPTKKPKSPKPKTTKPKVAKKKASPKKK